MAASLNDVPNPKYSMKGPGTKKFKGWTEEGIKRFNELFEMVEEDRNVAKGFDVAFQQRKQAIFLEGKKKRKQISSIPDVQVVTARIEKSQEGLVNLRRKIN